MFTFTTITGCVSYFYSHNQSHKRWFNQSHNYSLQPLDYCTPRLFWNHLTKLDSSTSHVAFPMVCQVAKKTNRYYQCAVVEIVGSTSDVICLRHHMRTDDQWHTPYRAFVYPFNVMWTTSTKSWDVLLVIKNNNTSTARSRCERINKNKLKRNCVCGCDQQHRVHIHSMSKYILILPHSQVRVCLYFVCSFHSDWRTRRNFVRD